MTTAVKPDSTQPLQSPSATRKPAFAATMLLIATICWGAGFTWAKIGGESLNRSTGAGDRSPLGPILLLGVRFMFAGILWFMIFPRARRGWSVKSVLRAVLLGSMLATGLMVQHLGLDRTSEAVSSFLTSTTIVWVPLLATIVLRRGPALTTWIAIAVAACGVWLMTAAGSSTRIGLGEWLGLACALIFSIHMLATNAIVPKDDPLRLTGGQFLIVGIAALAVAAISRGSVSILSPANIVHWFSPREIWLNFFLMIVFPTITAFGLANAYQPGLDPTRAILIYLLEPIFASIYALLFAGRGMTRTQITGAAMILIANGLVELLEAWMRRRKGEALQADLAPREIV